MTTTSTTKKPRTAKTPAQRAQEALDVEQRRVDRLTAKRDDIKAARAAYLKKVTADLEQIEPDLKAAEERRDWCAKSPDLPKQPPAATATTTTGAAT